MASPRSSAVETGTGVARARTYLWAECLSTTVVTGEVRRRIVMKVEMSE
jgi:hypothetical protein